MKQRRHFGNSQLKWEKSVAGIKTGHTFEFLSGQKWKRLDPELKADGLCWRKLQHEVNPVKEES